MNRQDLMNVIYRGLIVACLIFVVIVGITLLKHSSPSEDFPEIAKVDPIEQTDTELPVLDESVPTETLVGTGTTPIEIDMSEIHINATAAGSGLIDWDRKYPADTIPTDAVWNETDVIAYYGNNLVPSYIPTDLSPSSNNATYDVVLSTDGEVLDDIVWLEFYHDYYEDGAPKLTEDIPSTKGFYLTASKIGLMDEFFFMSPTVEGNVSYFGDTAVSIGYNSVSYGPYESPTGCYALYTAKFTLNGIDYELVFSQIELTEVIKVVASIVYGQNEFIIVNEGEEIIYGSQE